MASQTGDDDLGIGVGICFSYEIGGVEGVLLTAQVCICNFVTSRALSITVH